MDPIEGKTPSTDWMDKYNGCNPCHPAHDCNCNHDCGCGHHHHPFCPTEEDIDSDTLYQQMQYAINELERIIRPLDLPEQTKFTIIHLATCNIRCCMNLLKLIQKNAADIAVLNERMDNASGRLATNETEIANIKGSISTINTNIATLESKHNNQQTQINDNAAAINELKAHKIGRCEFDKVAATVCENYKAIANLQGQVTNNKTATDAAIAEVNKKVATIETKCDETANSLNELKAVVTPAKISAMDQAIAENAKGIELVKQACTNNREYIGKVAAKVEEHNIVLKKVVEDHKQFAAEIASNTAGVDANRKDIVALKAAVETLQATDDVHGTDIAKLKVRCDAIDQTIEDMKTGAIATNTSINNRLVVLEENDKKYIPMFEEDHSNLDALEEKVNGMEARLEETQTAGENVAAKVTELEGKVEKNVTDIKALNETIATVNQNMADGFENINTNVANGFNTINGGINNEIRPAIAANAEAIAGQAKQIGDLQTSLNETNTNLEAEKTAREEKDAAQDATLANTVQWTDISDKQNPNRKTILLKNHDSISGLDTKGVGHNLVMVSKWDKADFGGPNVPCNLNGTELTYNDTNNISHTPKE